jgi:DNA repair exonuclease SbcCD ATPase subunit
MNFELVKIKNFLTLADAELGLADRGLVLIQGANQDDPSAKSNGAGKSSMVDAICWALYGVTARGVTGDAVINKVAGKGCWVELTLRDDKTVIMIRRHRKDPTHKNALMLWVDEKDCTKGTDKETQDAILKLVGCSQDVFMASVYAGQERMPDLPGMTDKQLKLLIEEAAGVERLEAAYTIARSKLTVAKNDLTLKQGLRASQATTLASEEASLLTAQSNFAGFEDSRKGLAESYTGSVKTIGAEALELGRKIKTADKPALLKRQGELDTALDGHKERECKREELRAAVVAAEREHDRRTREEENFLTSARRLKHAYEHPEEAVKGNCEACGKPHDASDVESYRTHIKGLLVEAVKQAKEAKAKTANAYEALVTAQKRLDEYVAAMPDMSALLVEQGGIRTKLGEVESLERNFVLKRKDMEREKAKADQALTEPNPHAATVKLLTERVSKIGDAITKLNTEIIEQEAAVQVHELASKVFGPAGVRAHILDTVTPYLNERTKEYLGALSDGNIHATWSTLTKSAKGEAKEKFSIEVINEKGAESFDGLSGGEKRKVRLACALALQDLVASRAAKPISLFVGDEIDDALDEAGLERLMGILERKARDRGTVLIISHNSLADWVDQIITVTKKGGVSTIDGATGVGAW